MLDNVCSSTVLLAHPGLESEPDRFGDRLLNDLHPLKGCGDRDLRFPPAAKTILCRNLTSCR